MDAEHLNRNTPLHLVIDLLKEIYPDQLPRKIEDIDTHSIAYNIGIQDVIKFLESKVNQNVF